MNAITIDVTEGQFTTAKDARRAGRVPMAYYGKGVENRSFSVDYQTFRRAFDQGGRSTIMHLKNEKGDEFAALVHEVQRDPISDDMIHVDMLAVNMSKPIHTHIPLMLVGTAPAVNDLSGVLIQSKDSVQVECLPKHLVHEIEVDISGLVDFHTSLTVGDIKVPTGITILDATDINIVTVSAPRAVIEEEAAPVAAEEKKEEGNAKSE
ncbi:50S ribosomal protein L25 [Candidatus Peregrinibacteria bacterium]|nr:MAG: 50S ribosomal protein L25 [Candidatus Peregrinibacteria bacterium]